MFTLPVRRRGPREARDAHPKPPAARSQRTHAAITIRSCLPVTLGRRPGRIAARFLTLPRTLRLAGTLRGITPGENRGFRERRLVKSSAYARSVSLDAGAEIHFLRPMPRDRAGVGHDPENLSSRGLQNVRGARHVGQSLPQTSK